MESSTIAALIILFLSIAMAITLITGFFIRKNHHEKVINTLKNKLNNSKFILIDNDINDMFTPHTQNYYLIKEVKNESVLLLMVNSMEDTTPKHISEIFSLYEIPLYDLINATNIHII